MDLHLYRRHLSDCKFKRKGQNYTTCRCPIWVDGKLNGKRYRKAMGTSDWARAERRIHALQDKPNSAAATGLTIKKCIESYVRDCHARKLADSTIVNYRFTLNGFVSFCENRGITDISEIDTQTLSDFRSGRTATDRRDPTKKRPIQPSTQRKELECLRAFGSFCVRHDWMTRNFAQDIRPPRNTDTPTMPFSADEIAALLSACDRIENNYRESAARARIRARALLLTFLYSGMRISDVVLLRRGHVDMATGKILVRTAKTNTPVYIKLHPDAVAALKTLPVDGDFFFWSGNGKWRSAAGSARRTVYCLAKLANIQARPHRFRDTFSVNLLLLGEDLRTVQLLLGHASIKTTEKHYAPYVAAFQTRLDSAVSKLDFTSSSANAGAQARTAAPGE